MSSYWDDIKSMAEEIRGEYPNPDEHNDERQERVHQDVDGSSWIIYYANNEEVLNETENEPDSDEVAEMTGPGKGWKDMRMVAAFLAMERDVYQTLKELDEEAEETADAEEAEKSRSRKHWDPRK